MKRPGGRWSDVERRLWRSKQITNITYYFSFVLLHLSSFFQICCQTSWLSCLRRWAYNPSPTTTSWERRSTRRRDFVSPECSCRANSPNSANPRTYEGSRRPTWETQKTDRTSYSNRKQRVTFEPLGGFEPFLNIDPSGQWKFKVISVTQLCPLLRPVCSSFLPSFANWWYQSLLVYFCWSRPPMLMIPFFFSAGH